MTDFEKVTTLLAIVMICIFILVAIIIAMAAGAIPA